MPDYGVLKKPLQHKTQSTAPNIELTFDELLKIRILLMTLQTVDDPQVQRWSKEIDDVLCAANLRLFQRDINLRESNA